MKMPDLGERFIEVYGEIISYNGNLQMNIKQLRVADGGDYDPADYTADQRENCGWNI